MDNGLEFDPKDYFNDVLKNKVKEESEDYIDNLIKRSNIDLTKNEETIKELKKWLEIDKKNEHKLSKNKISRRICYIFIAIGVFAIFLGSFYLANIDYDFNALLTNGLICFSIGIIDIIVCILLIVLKLNKNIKKFSTIDNENNSQIEKIKKTARKEISPLLAGFTNNDFNKIANKVTDIIQFDNSLEYSKMQCLREQYGLKIEPGKNESIVATMSGSLHNNPFIRFKTLENYMYNKTYFGSIVITWTETVSDGDGGSRVVTRSQTLTASVTALAPGYQNSSYLIYGNEAAPDLRFSRKPTGIDFNANDNEIDKYVRKNEKQAKKLSEKSIKTGGNFTLLANTKFETLFEAFDRNNETQFRLLFTPLAQQNMTEIITESPYGDDFTFFKRNKINIISTIHSSNVFEYDENAFKSYLDVKEIKEGFVQLISSLYQSVYYDLAPIIAIPLYQVDEGGKYNPKAYNRQVSDYEAEVLANRIKNKKLIPNGCDTAVIKKVSYDKTIGCLEFFNVVTSGFNAISRVTVVPRMGGDGNIHQVPVHWIEYIPMVKESKIAIRIMNEENTFVESAKDDKEFNDKFKKYLSYEVMYKNYIGFLVAECYNDDEDFVKKIIKYSKC